MVFLSYMRTYTLLNLGPLARSYPLKLLAIAFIGIHLPLMGVLIYTAGHVMEHANAIISLTILFTAISTTITLYLLHDLLTPVRKLNKTMQHFHATGELLQLPTGFSDEVGKLMTSTQEVLRDRKAMELERQRMVQRLRVRNQNLRDQLLITRNLESFEHLASHDLQEPIRALCIELQYLKRLSGETLSQEQQAIWDRLYASCEKLKNSISGLVELAGLKKHPTPIQVDLPTLWKTAWEEQGMDSPAPTMPELQRVEGSPLLLQRLFSELIDNARKFRSPSRPLCISIHAKQDRNNVYLWIGDNGMGFDVQFKNRIFATFEKLDGAQTEGVGLGLTVCREIAVLHGGTLTADSEQGKGSTFLLQLPILQQRDADKSLRIQEGRPFGQPGYSISA